MRKWRTQKRAKRCPECGALLQTGDPCPCQDSRQHMTMAEAAASFHRRAGQLRAIALEEPERAEALEERAAELEKAGAALETVIARIQRYRKKTAG